MTDHHPLAPDWLAPRQDTSELETKLFPQDTSRTAEGELSIGGIAVSELAETYGTPLYVLSETDFRARARGFREAFTSAFAPAGDTPGTGVDVYYAGKAFLSTHAARWAAEEGLNIDTASGGELAIALAAGIDPARIGLHGNNKSDGELKRAVELGVGRIIADSVEEIDRIAAIAAQLGRTAPVMLRLTPGVHASTHEYIATAHEDQKFGLVHPPGHRRAEERLARVEDVGAREPVLRGECGRVRLTEELCAGDEVVDVEDECRRAEAFGEVGHGVTGDGEDAV